MKWKDLLLVMAMYTLQIQMHNINYIQDVVTYLCSRDTVNPVYNPLRELVGIYVEEVRTSLD